jgi:hypothetical protein
MRRLGGRGQGHEPLHRAAASHWVGTLFLIFEILLLFRPLVRVLVEKRDPTYQMIRAEV